MTINKPRILYIATFPPPVHGSAVVSMQIKNSKLINDEFDGDYVNLSTSRSMDEIGKGGVYQKCLKLSRFLKSLFRTFWLLLTHRYALCYCAITISGPCFLRDAPFVLLCKMFGHKVVIHQHNKGLANSLHKPLYLWVANRVYKNSKVILLSWNLYSDIEQVVKKEQVMICPNGIRPSDVQLKELDSASSPTESLKLKDNEVPHIFFLSNLIIAKGVYVLLDALKILKDKGYSFVCDFVGGETKEIDAKRFAQEVEQRGLNQVAIYHGRKYGDEKDEYWQRADIFTLPSFNEAFPLVNLEAMEQKLPIVSTRIGGIPDEVKDGVNGFIVEPMDSASLASALQKLLDSESLRKKMGEKGYELFQEKFTEERFEQCLLGLLKSVNGGGKLNLVTYWGKKYGEEKAAFWQDADIFVFPTYYYNECFPLVLLEAMEKGVACVSTIEGGICDIIDDGKTGFVVPRQDAKATADAIEKLLLNPDLCKQMGAAGRKKFEEQFTEERFEKTMLECLKRSMG